MQERVDAFLQMIYDALVNVGMWISRQLYRLLELLRQFWSWYQSINWPEIPLTPIQWIVGFYLIFGLVFAWATPIFEVSDELWHFGMVEYIREEGALPVQDPDAPETPFRQEGSQPPLYYALMAAITSPINISDADLYRQPNPHARAGETGSWGNKNLVLHNDEIGFGGTPLAVYVIRVLSLLMGTVTVYAVYKSGQLISPHRPIAGWVAAIITAFNPMFLFISASVNNDTLVIMLNSLVIWFGLLTMKEGFNTRRSLLIAFLLALATLTKLSALVLVPVLALGALWVAQRDKNWRGLLILGTAMFVLWASIAGWWYVRNYQLYDGDLFGTSTMAAVAGEREEPFTFSSALAEFEGFRQSYWGVFGAFNIITSPLFYAFMDFFVFMSLFGLIFVIAQLLAIQDFSFARRELTLVLFLLSILLIGLIAFLNWTAQTYASQGRLLFPYFAAISPLLAVGFIEIVWWSLFLLSPPDRSFVRAGDAVPEPILRETLRWPVRVFGFVVILLPFLTIAPQYTPPEPIFQAEIPEAARTVYARFDDVELIAYDYVDRRYFPGDTVRFTLYWRVLGTSENDRSLALALVSPFGDVISERTINTYPGAGTLRTSTWQPDMIYADTYEIQLARNLNARYPFDLEINWYEDTPADRITPTARDNNEIYVSLDMGAAIQPNLRVSIADIYTPEDVERDQRNFGQQLVLRGFAINEYIDAATFSVDVLWEAVATIDTEYTTFVHVYDADGQLVAQDDFVPDLPTRYWSYSEEYRLTYFVTPPEGGYEAGDYTVHVGWYDSNDPAVRLILEPGTEYERSTFEMFTFTVDDLGMPLLPVFETAADATEEPEVQGAPPAPTDDDIFEQTEEPEATESDE